MRRLYAALSGVPVCRIGVKGGATLRLQIVTHIIEPPEFVEQAIPGKGGLEQAADRPAWNP
jgi:hypothetical protein